MNKSGKEFIVFSKRLCLFAVCLFAADRLIGTALKKGYENYPDAVYYGVNQCSQDLLLFGSSRCSHHYVPDILSGSLGGSCYNLGHDGQNIYYHYGLLKSVLERHKPEMVIFDLIYIDYLKTPSKYDRDQLSVFLPLHRTDALKEVIGLRGKTERIKLLSAIYPFNSQLLPILGRMAGYEEDSLDGYYPLTGSMKGEREDISNTEMCGFDYDPDKLAYVEKAIRLCLRNGVKVVLCASPVYADMKGRMPSDTIRCIAGRNGVPFFNYEQDTAFINHPELFRDRLHLNGTGAEIYSAAVARRIKELLYN